MMVDRVLTLLKKENPALDIMRIEVVSHPLVAWKNGIRMIPALQAGNRILSGILLGENEIRQFIWTSKKMNKQSK